ncbi:MAG: NAD(+)/NADH kinase, partial [Clostridia bacterium]|nr:NAD(+)/NADH kinase [Clostridia bacterium]
MRIAVLPNYRVADVEPVVGAVCEKLAALGAEVTLPQDRAFPPADYRELIEEADAVLAFGGDGTLIHTAKHAAPFGKPVLGINCGHLGFMAGMEGDELSGLSALIEGNYAVDSRMMLEVTLHTKEGDRVFHALNEAVISRGNLSRMVALSVLSDGKP